MERKKRRKNRLGYGLIALAVLIVLVILMGKSSGWLGGKTKISVTLGDAKRVHITEQVSASGMIQPIVEVKISPEVSAEIIALNVEEGDSVAVGRVLARLKPDNLQSILDRTQASLSRQKATLAQAQAGLAKAQAQYERMKLEYRRQKKLHADQAISNADMEKAEANFEATVQDLKAAEKNVEAAKYTVQSAQASVKEASENLGFTTIRAPMTGIVSKLNVEKGERVVGTSQMAGTEMMRIADLNHMEVRVDVNENDIVRVHIGDSVEIEVDAYSYLDKKFAGRVSAIANSANKKVSADAVTEFQVKIKVLNSSYRELLKAHATPFRPGMTASVDVFTHSKQNVLSVPLSAVTTRKPKRNDAEKKEKPRDQEKNKKPRKEEWQEVVFVYDEGIAKKRKVKTGISDFDDIEILSGVSLGERVITGPYLVVSKTLKNEDEVEVMKKAFKDLEDLDLEPAD